jgi:HK97 family phage major capsid protein
VSLKRLEEVDAELGVIAGRLAELEQADEPDGDEVARAKVLAERDTETDDLIARYKALQEEREPLLVRAQNLADIRTAAKDIARTEPGDGTRYLGGVAPGFNKKVDPFEGIDARTAPRSEVISRSMMVIDREKRVPVSDASRAHLDYLIHRSEDQVDGVDGGQFDGSYIARRTLLTENAAYRSAFQKYIRFGPEATLAMTAPEQASVAAFRQFEQDWAQRAAGEVTTTAGGFGVPVIIDSSIVLTSGAIDAPILRYSRIEQVTNNIWKGVSSAGMTWSFDTEAAEVSDDTPTLAQPSVTVHMARGFLPYSVEVGMDYPGFATEFGRLLDQGYNDLLAVKSMTGSGTAEPWGIFTAIDQTSASEITPTTDGAFGGVDVFKAWNALPERFRRNATWVMSVHVESAIRQFAAAAGSSSAYFTVDLTADGVSRVNGRPVVTTDYAPTFSGAVPGTTGPQNILVVGDFQHYVVAQRAGMSVENIPHLFHTSNNLPSFQRGLAAWARVGMDSIADRAFILLQNQ